MIEASRSQLAAGQFQKLVQSAAANHFHNRFCALNSGRVGRSDLVRQHDKVQIQHDFLALANDFIEYSQLDQAMDVLETGVSQLPERQDLQQALLQLYKSTDSRMRFQAFRQNFLAADTLLINDWQTLAGFFAGQSA